MNISAISPHVQIGLTTQQQQRQTSGHEELDQLLYGGWPCAGLIELNFQQSGIGELRLLWPLLQQQQQDNNASLQVWINPPAGLHAQALAQAGINLQRLVIVQCANPQEALWAAEQSLLSGCCEYVLLWHRHMHTSAAKRLQWAAKNNQALLFWLREDNTQPSALPISARLQLTPCPQGLQITVTKLQGQWPPAERTICLASHWPELHSQKPPVNNNVVSLR